MKLLSPERVTALIVPPVKPLSRRSTVDVEIVTASSASNGIGLASVSEPVIPVVPRP